jgi:hypothetical protein
MNIMDTRKLLLVCAALLIAVAPAFCATTGPQNITIGSSLTNWSNTWLVNQFDTSLGTLTGITLDVSGDVSAILRLTNASSKNPSSGTANGGVTISVTGGGLTQTLDIATSSFNYSLAKSGTGSSSTLTGINTANGVWTASAILDAFKGTGTTTLNLSAVNFSDLHNVGGATYISDDSEINAGTTLSLVYTYTAVPEPTTIAILGIGALSIFRKKNK